MGSGSHGADTARTLANPGRTSLHSQPETHIIQVVQGQGLRWDGFNADGDVSIGRRICEEAAAAKSFPPKPKCTGNANRIWKKGE